MPRSNRENLKANTNSYHVLLRGINKQDIFLDNQDRAKFLKELMIAKKEFEFKIYAFALMKNHVHIAIFDKNNKLPDVMHFICSKYAMYFNKKYDRVGHVFQNRYKSIGIENENYLFNVIRYIHKNPEKACICRKEAYKWSSYREFINSCGIITDVDLVLKLFGKTKREAINNFIKFNNEIDTVYSDAEFEFETRLSDEEAKECIKRILNVKNIIDIQRKSDENRNKYIYEISQIKGIASNQIGKMMKISERTVQRIINKYKRDNSIK